MKYCDSHNDCLTYYNLDSAVSFLKCSKTRSVKILCCAVFTHELSNPLTYIKTAKIEIEKLKPAKKFLLSVEDCGFVTEKNLMDVVGVHPVSCSLTWGFDNHLAGGDKGRAGLTSFGVKVIKLFEKNNILIDTAHLNRKSFYQFCRLSKKPIYNSHCGVNKVCSNKRNLTDNQIKLVFDSDGFMGICLVSYFLTKKHCSPKTIATHFDYVINKFGYKNIGFGTDFFGTKQLPVRLTRYKDLWLVLKELRKMGHSRKILKHIAYKNYINFLKRNKLA